MKEIEVAAAIIIHDNKILCVQRSENSLEYISKKYEFPGGKVEENESPSDTVIREILEELRIKISIDKEFTTVDHTYPDFHITMHTFICSTESTDIQLTEHIDYKWLSIMELPQLDWAAADIPIVHDLVNQL